MKVAIFLIASLTTCLAWANSSDPLKVEIKDRYQSVSGDGYEEGVEITFEAYGRLGNKTLPVVDVPPMDNYADCDSGTPVELEKKVFSPNNADSLFRGKYRVFVSTSVEGDSGGCLIWVKDAGGGTVGIVDYSYVTDF